MKELFNSLGIVMFFKTLFKYIKVFLMVLSPFFIFYGVCFIFIIIYSFIMWRLPSHIPLPFIGETVIDRILLLIGLFFGYGYYMEFHHNKKD